jgi:DNA-binding XRE family transcriptional regulator
MTAQIVEIAGQKIAMLPEADYRVLLELAEEREDILAAERAEVRRLSGEEYVPFSLVESIISGENALKAWRKYRGITASQLSQTSGIGQSRISELERGKAHGKPATWRALADALKVTVDDILPLD